MGKPTRRELYEFRLWLPGSPSEDPKQYDIPTKLSLATRVAVAAWRGDALEPDSVQELHAAFERFREAGSGLGRELGLSRSRGRPVERGKRQRDRLVAAYLYRKKVLKPKAAGTDLRDYVIPRKAKLVLQEKTGIGESEAMRIWKRERDYIAYYHHVIRTGYEGRWWYRARGVTPPPKAQRALTDDDTWAIKRILSATIPRIRAYHDRMREGRTEF